MVPITYFGNNEYKADKQIFDKLMELGDDQFVCVPHDGPLRMLIGCELYEGSIAILHALNNYALKKTGSQ